MALSIDIYSDVVCPWCYLGDRRLKRALALMPEIETKIRWKPFRLDPTIPPEGIDRTDYLSRKFGSLEAIAPSHQQLTELGRAEDLDYRFDAITRSPNTVDAHRLIRWAGETGTQEAMVDRLFAAYFTEGKDVGDLSVLSALAADVGFNATDVGRRLASDKDRAAVIGEVENAYRIGVTGVPCFVLAGKYAIMGAQEPETLVGTIRQIAAETTAAVPAE